MTEAMKITLSTQPADARWGEKASYSINNDGIAPAPQRQRRPGPDSARGA